MKIKYMAIVFYILVFGCMLKFCFGCGTIQHYTAPSPGQITSFAGAKADWQDYKASDNFEDSCRYAFDFLPSLLFDFALLPVTYPLSWERKQ